MKACFSVLILLGIAVPSCLWAQKTNVDTVLTRSRSSIPSINENVSVLLEPQPINLEEVKRMLRYPDAAGRDGVEGSVMVRILVDERGDYMRHRIITTSHASFSKVIDKHIKKLIFTPAVDLNRKETKYWISLPFYFEMRKTQRGRR